MTPDWVARYAWEWAAKGILLLVLALALGRCAFDLGGRQARKELIVYRLEVRRQALEAERGAAAQRARQQADSLQREQRYLAGQQVLTVRYQQLKQRVKHHEPKPAPPIGGTDDQCHLDADFVRLWNAALDPDRPVPAATAGADAAAAGTDTAEIGVVSLTALQDNHLANAEQYARCRDQLNAWIDFAESLGGTAAK